MMKHAVMTALYLVLALFLTASQGDSGPCQSPIQHGVYADGRDQKGTSALMPAASTSKPVKDVRTLLWAGASPNVASGTGETALIAGADNRHVRIVWALLVPEAAPGTWDRKGSTGLTKAGEHGNTAIVQGIVASGVDVSPCDRNSEAALMTDAAIRYQEPMSVTPVTGAENSVPTPYG
jgi:uncharacterized protein